MNHNHSVLVVSDDFKDSATLISALEKSGCRVRRAKSPAEGREILRRERVDLLVVADRDEDQAPEFNLIEFCRRACPDERLKTIPILLLRLGSGAAAAAAAEEKVYERRAKPLNVVEADYCLEWPCEPLRLAAVAARLIERRKAENELPDGDGGRTRLQKQNSVINELTRRRRLFDLPLEDAIREITEIAARTLNVERVGVWLRGADKSKIRAIDLYELNRDCHTAGMEVSKSENPAYFRALAEDVGNAAATDARRDRRARRVAESHLDPPDIAASMLDAPIRIGGRVVGVICYERAGAAPSEWKPDEQNFASAIAGLISLLLEAAERRQAEEALRRSQRQYRELIDSIEGIVWECDAQTYIFSFVSRQAERLLGYPLENWLGDPDFWGAHIHPDDRDYAIKFCKQSAARGLGKYEFDYRMIAADGRVVWLRDIVTVDAADKENMRLRGVMVDITEQKRVEEAIRFQAHLLDTVEQAVIATDLNGKVTYWNRFAHKLYGWTEQEALGRSILELTAPEEERERASQIMKSLGDGESWSGEFPVKTKNGRSFPAHVMNSPIHDGQGNLIGVVGFSQDISERKRAESALAEANRRAIRQYDLLLQRLSALAQATGAARDAETVFRAILEFAREFVPCSALFISLYDRAASARKGIYFWYNGREVDASGIQPVQVGDGPVGRVINSGEVLIFNDYPKIAGKKPSHVFLGYDEDSREPRSLMIAPMKIKGETIGTIEVQSYEREAYSQEHATAMRMAANLAANALENVNLLEQEKRSAEQLRQSQKLESVGRLAGGIAHDFNNMLTAINGYSELTLRQLSADDPLRRNLEEIKKAGERSAALTYQLLAFSRRQMLKTEILEINQIVNDVGEMLKRLIGEHIQLKTILDPRLGLIKADPGQLTQVIMNLSVNARDAMPDGGDLVIETGNVYLDEEYAARHFPTRQGHYVMLAVSDTGSGIDEESRQHIFEPFYTTKETGEGTGLGLPTVYGIVKQSGGYIWVDSKVGVGTTFKIYLPRIDQPDEFSNESMLAAANAAAAPPPPAQFPKGSETILLAEDEELVRNLTRQILDACGYRVIEAADGAEALAICQQPDAQIDLLLTDVVMPKISGRELVERLRQTRPEIKVLYMSGYTDDTAVRRGVVELEANYIQKPFTFQSLAEKVRELLDAKKPARAAHPRLTAPPSPASLTVE